MNPSKVEYGLGLGIPARRISVALVEVERDENRPHLKTLKEIEGMGYAL